ncbi:ASCH domain-containing protein [Agrilactobacillus fermenti]|uniref:ASCH domain-containing protein n=1 Tax=Agrilactobacillus fermenti TaxID=2586909 RepID=UPI001E3DA794|nr:ASCH domain-containing protein [Agrilactobacillus fermenti]MCD2255620.1 isomerase [Agrilactobacillus fermenti]
MEMAITHDQFMLIQDHIKTIEVRLNDAKRQKLKIGSHVTLVDLNDRQTLTVEVTDIIKFSNFKALYTRFGGLCVGAGKNDSVTKMTNDTYKYYTPDQELENGVLAIQIKLT